MILYNNEIIMIFTVKTKNNKILDKFQIKIQIFFFLFSYLQNFI